MGLLAAIGGGSANFNWSTPSTNAQFNAIPAGVCDAIRQSFGSINFTQLITIGGIVGVVMFLINTYARSGLYRMISAIEDGEPLSVGAGFSAAGEKFIPLLAVRVLLALPIVILGIWVASAVFSMFSGCLNDTGLSTNFNIGSFVSLAGAGSIIFVLTLLLQTIGISAERAIVLDDLSVMQSIARGWTYMWRKFADYFVIGLIWILLTFGVGFLFLCTMIPFFFAGFNAELGSPRPGFNITTFTTTLVGPILIGVVIVGLLFGIFLTVFEASVWTLAYRIWRTSDQPTSNIIPS